jgi:rod shape-determining protein MreD
MSRIAGSETEVAIRDLRRRYVPLFSTLAAILLGAVLPWVAQSPWLPNLGFLILLTWRLMRPEIWPIWAAAGFGIVADIVSGSPLGQSTLLWTAIFLGLDSLDAWMGARDYWLDWAAAGAAILFHSVGVWYIALLMHSEVAFFVMVPQLVMSVLAYPIAARIILSLDRWRLAR